MGNKVEVLVRAAKQGGKKYLPQILTGLGIVSFAGSVGLTIRATVKAKDILEKKEKEKGEPLTKKEKVKEVLPVALAPAGMFALGTAEVVAGQHVSASRLAEATALVALGQKTINEYRDKIQLDHGLADTKDLAEYLPKNVAKEEVAKHSEEMTNPDLTSTYLYYDSISGRFFKMTQSQVERGAIKANKILSQHDVCTLNDLYHAWGVPEISIGDDLHWSNRDGIFDPVEIMTDSISDVTADDKGRLAYVIEYYPRPEM